MLTMYICIGSACHLKGSYEIINAVQQKIKDNALENKVEICATFCLGHCTNAVSVKLDNQIFSLSPAEVDDFFEKEVIGRL